MLALPTLNDELRGPLIRGVPKLRVGLRLLDRRLQLNQLRSSLFELLIEIGRRDGRQDFVLRHMRADVLVPGANIAAGAGEERASVESRDIARKNQLLFSRSMLGPDNAHGLNRLGVGPGRNLLSALGAIGNAEKGEARGANRKNADDQQDTARFGALAGVGEDSGLKT